MSSRTPGAAQGPSPPGQGLLASVSTVKESPGEIQTFVRRNLQRGLDHMFVVLDGAAPEAAALLHADPHVTCIEATAAWWGGNRPTRLNGRQGINANLVKALLTTVPSVDWLFHLDADEVVDIDRTRLLGLPSETRVVTLQPLEVISQRRPRKPPTEFKRPLNHDELVLLRALGVLNRASNSDYFRGHLVGKPAMRPCLDLNLGIHRVRDLEGARAESYRADWLRVLHLHTPSREVFVRRWENLLTSGAKPRMRRQRAGLAAAMAALYDLDLPRTTLDRYLTRLYDRTSADAVQVLRDLHLLEHVELDRRVHSPLSLPTEDLRRIQQAIARVRGEDKEVFRRGSPEQVRKVLDTVTA